MATVEALGFAVDVDHRYDDSPQGTIAWQFPSPGAQSLIARTTVELTVSLGPAATSPPANATPMVMPDVVGMTRDQALETIRQLNVGFTSTHYVGPGNGDVVVVRQEPAAGTDVYSPEGSWLGTPVKIWVSSD